MATKPTHTERANQVPRSRIPNSNRASLAFRIVWVKHKSSSEEELAVLGVRQCGYAVAVSQALGSTACDRPLRQRVAVHVGSLVIRRGILPTGTRFTEAGACRKQKNGHRSPKHGTSVAKRAASGSHRPR